jgi:rod shape determining protein RodA
MTNPRFLDNFKKIPALLPFLITIIAVFGIIMLYSAAGGSLNPWAYKQLIAFLIFMPMALLIALIDIRRLYNFAYIFYFITLFLLILVHFFGRSAMGATRWLELGFVSIQPSELVKVAIVLSLARFFHNRQYNKSSEWSLLFGLMMVLAPVILVIKQPDLGTGMITLMLIVAMFFIAGVRLRYFIIAAFGALLAAPVIWMMLHEYQKKRILIFLNPEQSPLDSGYNIIQSQIAIGSGGFFGKGLLQGTQGQLNFLPEYQTDFIFAFLAEETGFLGGAIVIALYSAVIVIGLIIAEHCKSTFARMMAAGITILFFLHVFINIAMVMGLVPVVGVPLPLISYGRTMMGSIVLGLGLVMNASVNKHRNLKL